MEEEMKWQPIETAPKDGTTVGVQLTRGLMAMIDVTDLPLVSGRSWQAHERRDGHGWYAVSDGVRMHRLLLGAKPGEIVDHIDGDGLNNLRANIRIGTQSLNCVNRKQTPGKYLRGVRPKCNKWRASIKVAGKCRSLGYFATEAQAHAAYVTEARRLYGDWMPLPEPPEVSRG